MTKRLVIFSLLTTLALAQGPALLKAPKGAPLAIVVFEDLQCPECRRAHPVLEEAARTYKIPLLRYDFPLPMHNWSYQAALIARYFDTQSQALGDTFRDYIFEHQMELNPNNLRGYAEKFAADHKVSLPFVVDPKGELAAGIAADKNLGQRVGLQHTPTIYLVNGKPTGRPFVEVTDRSQLYQLIDAMKRE